MGLMRLAITMRTTQHGAGLEQMDALAKSWYDVFHEILPEAILISIPNNLSMAKKILNDTQIHGLILSGGDDLGSAPTRDRVEAYLLSLAEAEKWPVLGVCRGMQVINTYFGGRLEKNVHSRSQISHAGTDHPVRLLGGLKELASTEELTVNSYHNHGVATDGLAVGFIALATAAGDLVEAFNHYRLPILGIMWHPERYAAVQDFDRLLIREIFRKRADVFKLTIAPTPSSMSFMPST